MTPCVEAQSDHGGRKSPCVRGAHEEQPSEEIEGHFKVIDVLSLVPSASLPADAMGLLLLLHESTCDHRPPCHSPDVGETVLGLSASI